MESQGSRRSTNTISMTPQQKENLICLIQDVLQYLGLAETAQGEVHESWEDEADEAEEAKSRFMNCLYELQLSCNILADFLEEEFQYMFLRREYILAILHFENKSDLFQILMMRGNTYRFLKGTLEQYRGSK